jgi:hypothetical protein
MQYNTQRGKEYNPVNCFYYCNTVAAPSNHSIHDVRITFVLFFLLQSNTMPTSDGPMDAQAQL